MGGSTVKTSARVLCWLITVAYLSMLAVEAAAAAWNSPDTLVGTWAGKAEVFAPFKKNPYPSKNPEGWIDIRIWPSMLTAAWMARSELHNWPNAGSIATEAD